MSGGLGSSSTSSAASWPSCGPQALQTALDLSPYARHEVILSYMLVAEATGQPAGRSFYHFLQWFFMIYTSVQWLALVAWSLAVEKQKEWLEELKTWAAGVVGVPGAQSHNCFMTHYTFLYTFMAINANWNIAV